MTEPEPPGIPPRIELDPHPEPERPFNPYQAPQAATLEPEAPAWSADEAPVPWEGDASSAVDRWWATIRLGFMDPLELSRRVPHTSRLPQAWLFFILTGVPSLTLNLTLNEMVRQAIGSLIGTVPHQNVTLQVAAAGLTLLVGPFVGGAFLHLFLWMWGGAKEGIGLDQTIRFTCYAQGVYYLIGWIPFFNILTGIAFWVFFSMGLAKAHRTDTWRGFAATLTPLVIGCCLILAAAVMIGARH